MACLFFEASKLVQLMQRSLETCHDMPSAWPADLKASTSLKDLQVGMASLFSLLFFRHSIV